MQDELDLFGMKQYEKRPNLDRIPMTPEEQFEAWKLEPGANHVLRAFYQFAAPYGARFIRTGRRVSVYLIREMVRDKIMTVHHRVKREGKKLEKWRGYTVNNTLTPYIARHIMNRRPDWEGMFEIRMKAVEKEEEKLRKAVENG